MVRLFQRVVRSFEVGLVVEARCVCVFLMVLRSVDVLRPNVLFSFPSVTNERARARMSAALSSTPRVSVCPRVVVRVGPILCAFLAAAGACYGSDVRCLGSRVDGVLRATVTAAARLARLRSGAAAVRALPFHNRCCLPVQLAGPPPLRPSPRRSLRAPVGEVPRRSRHAWTFRQVYVRVRVSGSSTESYGLFLALALARHQRARSN